jgi:hypothetical protein
MDKRVSVMGRISRAACSTFRLALLQDNYLILCNNICDLAATDEWDMPCPAYLLGTFQASLFAWLATVLQPPIISALSLGITETLR